VRRLALLLKRKLSLPCRGYRTQPRVSTLGTNRSIRFALKLKGREKRALRHIYNDTCFRVASTFDLPPLQGASLRDRFPGLKPWAEPCSHLRGINHLECPLQMSKRQGTKVPGITRKRAPSLRDCGRVIQPVFCSHVERRFQGNRRLSRVIWARRYRPVPGS
jgi:hypothetical protein